MDFCGELDVVQRVVPMSPTPPNPSAFLLHKGLNLYMIGPPNGGLPWPDHFSQLEKWRERICGLRSVCRL